MLGWGHGPNASEHEETERQPGSTEQPLQIIRTQGPFNRLIERRTGTEVRNGEDEKPNFRH
jgi:hypothetical protein